MKTLKKVLHFLLNRTKSKYIKDDFTNSQIDSNLSHQTSYHHQYQTRPNKRDFAVITKNNQLSSPVSLIISNTLKYLSSLLKNS